MTPTQTLNVALSGYGYVGKTFHAPLISATPGLRLASIMSRRPEAVQADYPDCQVYGDWDTLLADPKLDLVVIVSPNEAHYPQARAALLAGKHVVVDKPFTVNLEQAIELDELASRTGKILSIFHNRRWDADFLALRQLMAQGVFGRINHFESRYNRYRPQVRQRWREQNLPGSGIWFDLGAHLLDQALQLFGMPLAIQATLMCQRQDAQATDYFDVTLRYPDFLATLHGSCLVPGDTLRLTVHAEQASFIKYGLDTQEDALKAGIKPGTQDFGIDTQAATLWRANGDSVSAESIAMPPGHYLAYYLALRDALLGTGSNPVPASEAIQVMRLLELAVQSNETRCEISV